MFVSVLQSCCYFVIIVDCFIGYNLIINTTWTNYCILSEWRNLSWHVWRRIPRNEGEYLWICCTCGSH